MSQVGPAQKQNLMGVFYLKTIPTRGMGMRARHREPIWMSMHYYCGKLGFESHWERLRNQVSPLQGGNTRYLPIDSHPASLMAAFGVLTLVLPASFGLHLSV